MAGQNGAFPPAHEFIADVCSIADIACSPWIVRYEAHGQSLKDFSPLQREFETVCARPAVICACVEVEDVYNRPDRVVADKA